MVLSSLTQLIVVQHRAQVIPLHDWYWVVWQGYSIMRNEYYSRSRTTEKEWSRRSRFMENGCWMLSTYSYYSLFQWNGWWPSHHSKWVILNTKKIRRTWRPGAAGRPLASTTSLEVLETGRSHLASTLSRRSWRPGGPWLALILIVLATRRSRQRLGGPYTCSTS